MKYKLITDDGDMFFAEELVDAHALAKDLSRRSGEGMCIVDAFESPDKFILRWEPRA